MKEVKAFQAEETTLLEAIQACEQAVLVLSKHHVDLAQMRAVAKSLAGLKSMPFARASLGRGQLAEIETFLQQADVRESRHDLRRGVPYFESYSPQSGQIYGVLKQLKEDFSKNLNEEQQSEKNAREEYDSLKAAKEAELVAGRKQLAELEQDQAEFKQKDAQAYEELNDTREQVETDKKFLANLRKRCSATDGEYEARARSRLEELKAA